MDEKTVPILAGAVVLLIIMLIPSMYTLAPVISGTATTATVHQSTPDETVTEKVAPTPTRTTTPIIINSTPPPTTAPTPVPTPVSYVTVIYRQTNPIVRHSDPQPNIIEYNKPATGSDYFTIYSLNNQEVLHALPYVSYSLASPPLVIDYTVTPVNITHVMHIQYKILAQTYEEELSINRHYEGYYFEIIVRDRDTGKIVARDGVGGTYGFESPKQLTIYKGGNYLFEFTGQHATVTLTMKVKKQGNIS
jgi:hypothetical protein